MQPLEYAFNMIPDPWRSFLIAIIGIGGPVFLLLKAVQSIEQHEVGLRTRFGAVVMRYPSLSERRLRGIVLSRRAMRKCDKLRIRQGRYPKYGEPVTVDPGIRWQVPTVHKYHKVQVTQQQVKLDNVQVFRSDNFDGAKFPSACAEIRVTNAYRWQILHNEPMEAVKVELSGHVGDLLYELGLSRVKELSLHRAELESRLRKLAKKSMKFHGYCIDQLKFGQTEVATEVATGRAISENGLFGASPAPIEPLITLRKENEGA